MVKERRWSNNEFQILGAATRKLRLPSSDLVVGTYKSPRCAERRPTLPLTSVSGVQTPRKYDGQVPRIQSKAPSPLPSRMRVTAFSSDQQLRKWRLWLASPCVSEALLQVAGVVVLRHFRRSYLQEALLSQRGRAMLRVCIASIQNVDRSLLLLVVSASDIPQLNSFLFSSLRRIRPCRRPSRTFAGESPTVRSTLHGRR